jgi:1-acyl-sn-glycerol-3-phosphate acyltransferase
LANLQVKDSLFKNPAVGALLYNAGNIGEPDCSKRCKGALIPAVDRKNKNNQKLFKGTFDGESLHGENH